MYCFISPWYTFSIHFKVMINYSRRKNGISGNIPVERGGVSTSMQVNMKAIERYMNVVYIVYKWLLSIFLQKLCQKISKNT